MKSKVRPWVPARARNKDRVPSAARAEGADFVPHPEELPRQREIFAISLSSTRS